MSTVIGSDGIENPAQRPMISTSYGRGRCSVLTMRRAEVDDHEPDADPDEQVPPPPQHDQHERGWPPRGRRPPPAWRGPRRPSATRVSAGERTSRERLEHPGVGRRRTARRCPVTDDDDPGEDDRAASASHHLPDAFRCRGSGGGSPEGRRRRRTRRSAGGFRPHDRPLPVAVTAGGSVAMPADAPPGRGVATPPFGPRAAVNLAASRTGGRRRARSTGRPRRRAGPARSPCGACSRRRRSGGAGTAGDDPVRLLRLLREPDPGRRSTPRRPAARGCRCRCESGVGTARGRRAGARAGRRRRRRRLPGDGARVRPRGRRRTCPTDRRRCTRSSRSSGRPGCPVLDAVEGRGPERLRRHHGFAAEHGVRPAVASWRPWRRTSSSAGRPSAPTARSACPGSSEVYGLHFGEVRSMPSRAATVEALVRRRDRRRPARDHRRPAGQRADPAAPRRPWLQPHENVVPLVRTDVARPVGRPSCARPWTRSARG